LQRMYYSTIAPTLSTQNGSRISPTAIPRMFFVKNRQDCAINVSSVVAWVPAVLPSPR